MALQKLQEDYDTVSKEFPQNSKVNNFFLAACYDHVRNSETAWKTLRSINKDSPHGGKIGPGNSCLNVCLRFSKIIRLHAVLHDAAGYMLVNYNVGPGYTYASCCCKSRCPYLGQVTGVFYCIGLKIRHPSHFRRLEL